MLFIVLFSPSGVKRMGSLALADASGYGCENVDIPACEERGGGSESLARCDLQIQLNGGSAK